MSWHGADDSEHFTVRLAENNPPFTVSRLLRHGMKTLTGIVGDKPVFIDELFLDGSVGEDLSVTCGFWQIDREQQDLQNENIKWREESKISSPTKEVVYYPSLDKESELRMLEYRLPQNENQWNGILLVESLADYIEQHAIDNVQDLILHNFTDEDAIEHPYIRLYYRN